jgi:hypothetical protein
MEKARANKGKVVSIPVLRSGLEKAIGEDDIIWAWDETLGRMGPYPPLEFDMLVGVMWQYRWGSRRELRDTYRELRQFHNLTGTCYGREGMFGVREDRSLPPGTWLFETEET